MRSQVSIFQLFILVIFYSLTSCFTPQKVIQMESGENQTTKWNYGREVVLIKKGDLEARIFFEEFTKKDLIFDVEVVNLGEDEILLEPEKIFMIADNGSKRWAFDPEKEIFGEQMAASRREAGAKNAAVWAGVATVATIVAIAAADDDDDGDNDFDFDGDTFVYINTATPPPPMDFQPPHINFWKDHSLRKTTLEKGYKVGGKVVFSRNDMAKHFTLIVPVGNVELKADFNQRIFQP